MPRLLVPQCKGGTLGSRLAGEDGEECAARRLGSVPAANYDSLGCQHCCQPSSKEVWGPAGGGSEGSGKGERD